MAPNSKMNPDIVHPTMTTTMKIPLVKREDQKEKSSMKKVEMMNQKRRDKELNEI